MARARNIKPSFFTNDELSELQPLARLLFIGLWTIADFKGCFEYKPKRLKVQLLPYDECNIEQLMSSLDESGFIAIYSVRDQQYGKVLNFNKHQNPHKNEKEKGSDIPDLPENFEKNLIKSDHLGDFENYRDENGINPADSLNLIPDSLNLKTENYTHETVVSSSDKPKRFDFKKSLIESGAREDLAEAFCAVRKTKKATNTQTAFQLFLNNVNRSGLVLNEVLEICIQRDWKGFDPSWLKNQTQPIATYQTPAKQNKWNDYFNNMGQASEELDVSPKKTVLIEEVGHA